MKTAILVFLSVLGLSIGLASAEPVDGTLPQQNGTQYNLTAGAAGWG